MLPAPKSVCRYVFTKDGCAFGDRCRFVHPEEGPGEGRGRFYSRRDHGSRRSATNGGDERPNVGAAVILGDSSGPSPLSPRVRFQTGRCSRGPADEPPDRPVSENEEDVERGPEGGEASGRGPPRMRDNQKLGPKPVQRRIRQVLARGGVSADNLGRLRRMEIDQFGRRYPRLRCLDGGASRFMLPFSSSDPDWPFDVKTFGLVFCFPDQYPLQLFTIQVSEDENLPETVRRYVEVSCIEWLEKKNNSLESSEIVERILQSFLIWLDRKLLEIVTEALKQFKREIMAKAAGFEFILATDLPGAKSSAVLEKNAADLENEESSSLSVTSQIAPAEDGELDDSAGIIEQTQATGCSSAATVLDPERKGTEIVLKDLQLRENAATLLFEKIFLSIRCSRCKTESEFSASAHHMTSIHCTKCNTVQLIIFRPALIHQLSSTMGYLDLEGCTPIDLVLREAVCLVGCLNCSTETKIRGLFPGQIDDTFCLRCHKRMRVAAEAVHFRHLQPSRIDRAGRCVNVIDVNKSSKNPKDPAIQPGSPLPNFGACRHFKKSYRWLRFPCCGKCYPCDLCHDEKELDHEMKYATRLICGFCCKEQTYTVDKPCAACHHSLTKSATAHWEGGKGCRDRTKMNRNDHQKYSNLNKTYSKRAQHLEELKSGKKK